MQRIIRLAKFRLSDYLSERSVVRHHQYPTRYNLISSVGFIIAAIPLAVLLAPFVALRAALKGSKRVLVLATEGEFGPFVQMMEGLRGEIQCTKTSDLVIVLSRHRHALCDLYAAELGLHVMTGEGLWTLIQQAVLLQPRSWVVVQRRTNKVPLELAIASVCTPKILIDMRRELLRRIGVDEENLVLMALNVLSYEEVNNPQYMAKGLSLESVGEELVPVVDYLANHGIPTVLVGSPDTGRSKIPRDIPRLSEFGRLGGLEEVALASTCRYFWTDNVGAWWLVAPFKKPVLFTNFARFYALKGQVPIGSLCLPTRYETLDGRRLPFRNMLKAGSSPYKAASRGELRMLRNTPDEIIDAHQEMLGRLNGTWSESNETRSLSSRFTTIMSEFPAFEPWVIPAGFLAKHPYLLE